MRFTLQTTVDGISSKVLSANLDDLDEHGLVDCDMVNEEAFRAAYSLTERGESLKLITTEMRKWGEGYLTAPENGGSM